MSRGFRMANACVPALSVPFSFVIYFFSDCRFNNLLFTLLGRDIIEGRLDFWSFGSFCSLCNRCCCFWCCIRLILLLGVLSIDVDPDETVLVVFWLSDSLGFKYVWSAECCDGIRLNRFKLYLGPLLELIVCLSVSSVRLCRLFIIVPLYQPTIQCYHTIVALEY